MTDHIVDATKMAPNAHDGVDVKERAARMLRDIHTGALSTDAVTVPPAELVERVKLAIHNGLGGNGWAYRNHGFNEIVYCADELNEAARAVIALFVGAGPDEPMIRVSASSLEQDHEVMGVMHERLVELEDSEKVSTGLSFADLRSASVARQIEWHGGHQPDLSFRAMELGGEVGEALNVCKKLVRERIGAPGSRATIGDLADELADVIICCELVASQEGIDLGEAVARKFNATSEKVGLQTRLAAGIGGRHD